MIITRPHRDAPDQYFDDDGTPLPDDHPEVVAVRAAMAWHQGLASTPMPILDPTVISARRAACNACDQFNSATDRCRACGCGDHMGRRVQSAFATCPMQRWPLPAAATP